MIKTPYEMAEKYIGIKEVSGTMSNALILAMLKLDNKWPEDDKVPWCSAFMNFIAWNCGLKRTKSLMARSWLEVGYNLFFRNAKKGFDVVILKRGGGIQPGSDIINAPGHVGWFDSFNNNHVSILAGNQNDSVNISKFHKSRILGIRRL